MHNILVTGASGFLGKHIVDALRQQGFRVDALGRSHNNEIVADLSGPLKEIDKHYDLVIHAAGKAHMVPKTAEEANSFFEVNEMGTRNLCEALKPPRQFVFISTVSVYGLEQGEMILESAPLLGSTPYAQSKIKAEAYLQQWANANQVKLTILRLPLVTGLRAPGNLGDMQRALRQGLYFIIGKGAERKSMIAAVDVAKCVLAAARVGGVFNLTDGRHPTMREVAMAVASSAGVSKVRTMPLGVAKLVALLGDIMGDGFPVNKAKLQKLTATLTFDDHKARQAFGFSPGAALETFKPYPE